MIGEVGGKLGVSDYMKFIPGGMYRKRKSEEGENTKISEQKEKTNIKDKKDSLMSSIPIMDYKKFMPGGKSRY